MRTRSRLLRGLLAACPAACLAAVTTIGVPSSASATVGPITSWTMQGTYGDPVLGAQRYDFDPNVVAITFSGDRSGLTGTADGWTVTLAPATGSLLAQGQTYSTLGTSSRRPDQNGLELSGHGRACTASTGTFTLQELTTDLLGRVESVTVSLEQRCLDGGAAYASIAWQSSTPAPPLPVSAPPVELPHLSVTYDRTEITYGDAITVTAQVSVPAAGHAVQVFFRPAATGVDALVASGSTDAQGVFRTAVRPTEPGRLAVRLVGESYLSDDEHPDVFIDARLASAVVGKRVHATSGVRLYRSSSRAAVVGQLAPRVAPACLVFHAQYFVRGSWGYDGHTRCLKLNAKSVTGIRLPVDRELVGIPIRVRPEWAGNDQYDAVVGSWVKAKLVR